MLVKIEQRASWRISPRNRKRMRKARNANKRVMKKPRREEVDKFPRDC